MPLRSRLIGRAVMCWSSPGVLLATSRSERQRWLFGGAWCPAGWSLVVVGDLAMLIKLGGGSRLAQGP